MVIKEGWALVKYRWIDHNLSTIFQGVRVELLHNKHNIGENEVVASGLESKEEAEALLKLMPDELLKQSLRRAR